MLKTMVDLIGCLPVDIELERKIDEYFKNKPLKTKKVNLNITEVYVVNLYSIPDNLDTLIPVCVCTSQETAERLIDACLVHNMSAHTFDSFDVWKKEHPILKYNPLCEVKTTDFYDYTTVPIQC